MGSVGERKIQSFRAGGVIAAFVAVKLDTDDNSVVKCGANERAIGVAQTAATAEGEQVEVALFGGSGKIKVNETIAKGKMLTATADGYGEVADAAGEWCFGVAMEAGVQNDVIWAQLTGFPAQGTDE
jgi:hypothetical protein